MIHRISYTNTNVKYRNREEVDYRYLKINRHVSLFLCAHM